MANDSDKTREELKRVKTGTLSRRWQLSKASMQYGRRSAGQAIKSRLGFGSPEGSQANIDAFVEELGKLKGSIVKIGQIMATYGDYLMPPDVVEALHRLEDNTPPLHWPAIEKQLRRELGERFGELEVEHEAFAAASLGQVHRARILASGEVVCLKIQYPGVAKTIDADFNDMLLLFKMARILESTRSVEDWFSDIRNLLHREVDYRNECAELKFARDNLAGDERYIVPRVVEEYCSERVICMSWEEGESLLSAEVAALPQSVRNSLGEAILDLFLTELYDWQRMQTDPNFGNYRVRIEGDSAKLVLLDFGAIRPLPDDFVKDFKAMIAAAYYGNQADFLEASIKLGFMKAHFPEKVLENFAAIGMGILEPLKPFSESVPGEALCEGQYDWRASQLPKRIAKRAMAASLSKYFALPPKEFLYVMRKLMGVYSLISALDGHFFGDKLLRQKL